MKQAGTTIKKTLQLLTVVVSLMMAGAHAAQPMDFELWDTVLKRHVINGHVDYPGLQSDPEFSALVSALASAQLDQHDPSTRLAFYINAYNMLAIQGIVDGHSPKSALGKLRYFYWTRFDIAGERISLDALENKRIRPMAEPRIHFAIVCASASCPRLSSDAYTPEKLHDQLEQSAHLFINDPTKNQLDPEQGKLALSKIFKWFEQDFGADRQAIIAYINRYLKSPINTDETARLKYLPYDWSLNGTKPKKKAN